MGTFGSPATYLSLGAEEADHVLQLLRKSDSGRRECLCLLRHTSGCSHGAKTAGTSTGGQEDRWRVRRVRGVLRLGRYPGTSGLVVRCPDDRRGPASLSDRVDSHAGGAIETRGAGDCAASDQSLTIPERKRERIRFGQAMSDSPSRLRPPTFPRWTLLVGLAARPFAVFKSGDAPNHQRRCGNLL